MKNTFTLFVFILITTQVLSQNDRNVNLYYGGYYFMPSNGYAHNIGIQNKIVDKEFINISGELSLLYGGPYGFNIFTGEIENQNKVSPYKVFHLAIGPNLEIPLNMKNKISFGLSAGFSYEEIPIVAQTQHGNGASVQVYLEPRNRLLLAGSIRYIHNFSFFNGRISIAPNYNFYKTSIYTQSAGVNLMFNL